MEIKSKNQIIDHFFSGCKTELLIGVENEKFLFREVDHKRVNYLDIKEVFSEAKSMGYDATIMRKILALRKMDVDERLEQETLLKTYKNALGIY